MKKIFFALISLLILSMPALAEITPEEVLKDDYVRNHGYSEEMVRLMNLQHAQINGTEPDIVDEPSYYKKFSLIRKFFIYFDPALDDGQFMQHDIKPYNTVDEL